MNSDQALTAIKYIGQVLTEKYRHLLNKMDLSGDSTQLFRLAGNDNILRLLGEFENHYIVETRVGFASVPNGLVKLAHDSSESPEYLLLFYDFLTQTSKNQLKDLRCQLVVQYFDHKGTPEEFQEEYGITMESIKEDIDELERIIKNDRY